MSPPRMRTLPKAVDVVKEYDPDTSFTLTALRRLIREGKVPAVDAGVKKLVNVDLLLEYLAAPPTSTLQQEAQQAGTIRRVAL